jgi:hypothetical protein
MRVARSPGPIRLCKNAALPALVNTVQKALKLDAASAPDGPDGSKAVKKILSGSVNIAVGVAELRNQGFGSGHGQASAPSGLGVRHARLTVNAAVTWCELILDTLSDPAAPWRKAAPDLLPAGDLEAKCLALTVSQTQMLPRVRGDLIKLAQAPKRA